MRRRAFTLVEVVIAIALIVLLLMGVIGFQWSLAETRARLLDEVRESQAIEGMIDRLENDLLAAIAGDPVMGAGVSGDVGSIAVLSRGVWLTGPEDGRRWSGETSKSDGAHTVKATLGDLVGCRYRYVREDGAATGRLSLSRWLVESGAGGPGEEVTVTEQAESVRFRYFAGGLWRESFDSLEVGGLPAAVEVSVWMQRGKPPPSASAPDPKSIRRPPDRVRVIAVPDGGVAGVTP